MEVQSYLFCLLRVAGKKALFLILLLTALIVYIPCAVAGIITMDGLWKVSGKSTMMIDTFSGNTSAIMIDLGDGNGSQSSGLFSFSLDTSKTSTATYDFDNNSLMYDLNVLVTFPLQNSLSYAPIVLRIVEAGEIPEFNLAPLNSGQLAWVSGVDDIGAITQPLLPPQTTFSNDSGTFALPTGPLHAFDFETAILHGNGLVTSGEFAGFGYTNGWEVTKVTLKLGVADVEITRASEPSTIAVFALGMIGLALRRFKKRS